MSERNYTEELKAKWVDPIELTPAFLHLAMRKDKSLSGQRLSAWDLSQQFKPSASRETPA
jgi:3-hydroxybutyrate dehydrogenase